MNSTFFAMIPVSHVIHNSQSPSPVSTARGLIDSALTDLSELQISREEVVIEPKRGWRSVDLNELWRYRELAYTLAWRDIQVRYKQTLLGAAWAVLQPLLTMVVFTIFLGRLGRMDRQTAIPYPVCVYASLLPWQFFSYCVTQGSQSLVNSSHLISKVYFPRLLIPLATAGVGIVDFAVASLMLIVLMGGYRIMPGSLILALPLFCLGLLITSLGVGTLLSAMSVEYRDVRFAIPFLIQLWMFASPVAYSLEIIPEQWRLVYALNPLAGVIGGFRACLLNEPLQWNCVAVSLGSGFVIMIGGTQYFRRVERQFADIA